jgi:CheY-like chemotaxis protein
MAHILIVANHADTHALCHVLEQQGYQVTVADDGPAAQVLPALATEPLVVLLDEGFPPLSGDDLLALCQQLGSAPAAREFLLLTEHPEQTPPPFQGPKMQLLVSVVAKSLDIDTMLAVVAAAAARLGGAA